MNGQNTLMVFSPVAKKTKLKTCSKINVQDSKRKMTQKNGTLHRRLCQEILRSDENFLRCRNAFFVSFPTPSLQAWLSARKSHFNDCLT